MLIPFWTHSDDSPSDVDQFVNYKVIKEPTSRQADESLWKPWTKWTINKSSQAPCPLKEQCDWIIFKIMWHGRRVAVPDTNGTENALILFTKQRWATWWWINRDVVWGWGNSEQSPLTVNQLTDPDLPEPMTPSHLLMMKSYLHRLESSSQPISTLPSVADTVNIPPIGSFRYAWN